jgi:N-acetylglucosamine-6-sulfatase
LFNRIAIVVAAVCALTGVLSAVAGANPGAAAAVTAKPNIVVFYLDDTNPTDGRLWNNPALTPNLYDLFVAHGINVQNAFGETPLCCPSRATLLTGLHTHNHGVLVNDARLFNPAENVGKEMTKAGYQSMLIGKYMNLPNLLTPQQWTAISSGWSQFDAFSSPNSNAAKYYYDYTMFTKQGTLSFGHTAAEHSTHVIADRAVAHLQQADPTKPVFQILSMFNTHAPNIPMPGLESDPRWNQCGSMAPWKPANYNEADVSDKPPYVRDLPLLPYPNGWPMVGYCRELLGVDWLVGRVVAELKAEGRFDNTMFMFAADNGMAWGQHRLGQEKQSPYVTRVPLYYSWQARWGTAPRTVNEYVSDIDFAPTFCAVGGCALGPYPGGQTKPDGVSLLPLLDGTATTLGRDALLEDSFETRDWAAVRTTPGNPLGLWHYIYYPSGFVELYNDATDPWELQNLANGGYQNLKAQLRQRLFELLAEGRPNTPATVTIVEDSAPNASQDIAYTGAFGSFTLDDDSDPALPNRRVFTNVTPGTYSVTQNVTAGWALKSLTCPFPTETNVATRTATFHVMPNDNIVCTFHNQGRGADEVISLVQGGPSKGNNIYAIKPIDKQTVKRTGVAVATQYDYFLAVLNKSGATESFNLKGEPVNTAGMTTTFLVGGVDVTSAVLAGTYNTGSLAPGSGSALVLRVTVSATAVVGDKSTVVVRTLSSVDHTTIDVVRAITTR